MIYGGIFDLDQKKKRLQEVSLGLENPAVWSDPTKLNKLNQEKAQLEKAIQEFESFSQRVGDLKVWVEMAIESQDESIFSECLTELNQLQALGKGLEIKRVLQGELDANSAFLSINAGAGGTEACDWAAILMRMFQRYAARQGFSVEILDEHAGEGAGIKSCTMLIRGEYAYGYLKAESGVHRLVRISPFDSNARRHTSFASVFVWPEVDDEIKIEISPDDLRVETFRASGAGGQHVNRTDSAVRLYHIPSGIVVSCQTQRSQIQNRETALKMLKAQLYQRELEERNRKKQEAEASKKANEWGSQIRSYVLHPYKLVKDHRTQFEVSQAENVLDGELQPFIMAYLKDHGATHSRTGAT
jgi:peptide chain release factor 2